MPKIGCRGIVFEGEDDPCRPSI